MSTLALVTHAYSAAAWRVVNDSEVWADELQRRRAGRLPWPPPLPSTKWDRLCHWLLVHHVELMLLILHASRDPVSPGLQPFADDPKMQVVLRVARRAAAKGEAAVIEAWGGERITVARDYKNLVIEQRAELALQAAHQRGLTRDEAFALFGLPRRQAFRAIKRKHSRRK